MAVGGFVLNHVYMSKAALQEWLSMQKLLC